MEFGLSCPIYLGGSVNANRRSLYAPFFLLPLPLFYFFFFLIYILRSQSWFLIVCLTWVLLLWYINKWLA